MGCSFEFFRDKNTIKDVPWIYNYILTGNLG